MQRAAIAAGANLLVGSGGLFERNVFHERDDAEQRRVVALQSFEIHGRQLGCRNPA
jgi:hypothetical protein